MRAALLMLLCAATSARASDVESLLRGRFGNERFAFLGATGTYGFGSSGVTPAPFSQFGGSVMLEGGLDTVITTLGSLVGFEGDLALGVARSELSADGTPHDQRDLKDDTSGEPKVWLRLSGGLRAKVSPLHFTLGDFGLRLGIVGGASLDLDGSRSFDVPGLWTFGAQVLLTGESFSLLGTWVWAPPQGVEAVLNRHVVTVHLSLGQFMVGARWTHDLLTAPVIAAPKSQGPQVSHALAGFLGFLF